MRIGARLGLWLASSAVAFFALLISGQCGAAPVASIVVEDGSTTALSNQSIVIDGGLGGPHAGQIVVANSSTLSFFNVSIHFENASAGGGVWVGSSSRLVFNFSHLTADPASRFAITVTGGAVLTLLDSDLTGLQHLTDLDTAAILVDGGGELQAARSTLRVRPDLRPLLDATQATVDFSACDLTGSLRLAQSTLSLRLVRLNVIGDTTAVDVASSSVTISNSTLIALGGASGIAASAASSVTVLSTNVTAEDIGVSGVGGSILTLRDVVVDAGGDLAGPIGAFGVVAQASAVTAENIAVFGFPTSLWLKSSDATLLVAQLSDGVVRLNGSRATIDNSPPLDGVAVVEDLSVLTLTDTAFDWSRVDVAAGSIVVPRYRSTLEFHTASGGPAAGVNWTVYPVAGPALGGGTSDASGASRGPPLDGPRFGGIRFEQAPAYRIEFSDSTASYNETVTAWGPGLVFPFYLDPALPDVAFSAGLLLSSPNPPAGSSFNASASLTLEGPTSPVNVSVRLMLDGAESTLRTVLLTAGQPANVTFSLSSQAGIHLVALRADLQASGRGVIAEASELANNFVSIWYNASSNGSTSVKPDLAVASLWFELTNTTGVDPVTGERRAARMLVVWLNISNAGLTGAGPFEVTVAAGINTSGATVPGIAAQSTTTLKVTFGPYLDDQDLTVLAQLDVRTQIDEGNEENNKATAVAEIRVPPPPPIERPLWVTLAVLAVGIGLVALSVWGVMLVFRREDDDIDPGSTRPPPETVTTPASPVLEERKAAVAPVAPPAPPVGRAPTPTAPPPPPPAAPGLGFAPPPPAPAPPPPWAFPPYYPPPPYTAYYPIQYPPGAAGAPYAFPQAAPPPGPKAEPLRPPARCPKCGSSQVSYLLHPVKQVACATCGEKTPF